MSFFSFLEEIRGLVNGPKDKCVFPFIAQQLDVSDETYL